MSSSTADDKGPRITTVSVVMLVLATTAVALRFWGRYIAHKAGYWWDDWLALASLPFVWASCAVTIYWVSIGLGRHFSTLHVAPNQVLLALFVENIIYNTGLTLVKMSVLMFYARIFSSVRKYQISFWVMGCVIVGWGIAINFLAIFTCTPVAAAWNPAVPGVCMSTQATFRGATISNIVIDLWLLLLPLPMLWSLHIGRARKVGLVGVFAAGYCVIILSVLRLISVVNFGNSLRQDITFSSEVAVALTSGCIPSIFNLAKHGMRSHSSRLFGIMGSSKALSGPAGSHIGPIGQPIEDRQKNGFVELTHGQTDRASPKERFHVSQFHSAPFSHPRGVDDAEMGIPLNRIAVQDDRVAHDRSASSTPLSGLR